MRKTLWPSPPGEARNLRFPHDGFFLDAANDLQKYDACLQQNKCFGLSLLFDLL
jgi:hypothetical protein